MRSGRDENRHSHTVRGDEFRASGDKVRQGNVARFRSLYTSRDGRMGLYEDHEGHLSAVNLGRLA